MSISDLTRQCYQNGKAPVQWVALCKLLIAKEGYTAQDAGTVEANICNSVLSLFALYPADPHLVDYFFHAIKAGTLSLATFVTTFLQAARMNQLQHVPTLNTLCQLALKFHHTPTASTNAQAIVEYSAPVSTVLSTVSDAIALLRTTFSADTAPFHSLLSSSSELLVSLLTCVGDLSQVSAAICMQLFADANDVLQDHSLNISPNLRTSLENFVLSLSLVSEENLNFVRDSEAQVMQSMQYSVSKGDIVRNNANTSTVFSLTLHHFVSSSIAIAGAKSDAVAILCSLCKWLALPSATFYTSLILAAFTCMSEASPLRLFSSWRNFVIGRLPALLSQFEKSVSEIGNNDHDWRMAMQAALASLVRQTDTLSRCDSQLSALLAENNGSAGAQPASILNEFLQQTIKWGLFDQAFAAYVDPDIGNKKASSFVSESIELGVDVNTYVVNKLSEAAAVDFPAWIRRITQDPSMHSSFSNAVVNRLSLLADGYDVEALSQICRQLYTNDAALPIIAMHEQLNDLASNVVSFLERFDCNVVGDPQSSLTHIGDVILFVQTAVVRFQLNRDISSVFVRYTYPYGASEADFTAEETAGLTSWFKALFDANSEGIEDNLIRTTKPRTLLRISGALLSQAIHLTVSGKMSKEDMNNGVSYFTGPLLSWTLVGVIKDLVRRLRSDTHTLSFSLTLAVIQNLVLNRCPPPVLRLCLREILSLTREKKPNPLRSTSITLNVSAVRTKLEKAGLKLDAAAPLVNWRDQPRQLIRETLSQAQLGKAAHLNVERCLLALTPLSFLDILWTELLSATRLGSLDACRIVAVFVFATPRARYSPLLSLFIHGMLPSLISTMEKQQNPEQTFGVELTATVLSSSLVVAHHLERVHRDQRPILGQTVNSLARDLAADLFRRRRTAVGKAVMQRLISSQSLITNFPVFMSGGDLGA